MVYPPGLGVLCDTRFVNCAALPVPTPIETGRGFAEPLERIEDSTVRVVKQK